MNRIVVVIAVLTLLGCSREPETVETKEVPIGTQMCEKAINIKCAYINHDHLREHCKLESINNCHDFWYESCTASKMIKGPQGFYSWTPMDVSLKAPFCHTREWSLYRTWRESEDFEP